MPTMPQSETQQIEPTMQLIIKKTTRGGKRGAVLYDRYGNVPLDKVWFLSSLSQTGYIISHSTLNRVCPNHKKDIACPNGWIWLMKFVCTSKQTNPINIMCICSIAIAIKWL